VPVTDVHASTAHKLERSRRKTIAGPQDNQAAASEFGGNGPRF